MTLYGLIDAHFQDFCFMTCIVSSAIAGAFCFCFYWSKQ